jgi:SAM domain (Sterile alpha motif)
MQQVADWLKNLGMSEYAERFAEIDFKRYWWWTTMGRSTRYMKSSREWPIDRR